MAADQLDRYRCAVADDRVGRDLIDVIARLTAARIQVAGAATLKSAPREYPKDHPRIELLRHRG